MSRSVSAGHFGLTELRQITQDCDSVKDYFTSLFQLINCFNVKQLGDLGGRKITIAGEVVNA